MLWAFFQCFMLRLLYRLYDLGSWVVTVIVLGLFWAVWGTGILYALFRVFVCWMPGCGG